MSKGFRDAAVSQLRNSDEPGSRTRQADWNKVGTTCWLADNDPALHCQRSWYYLFIFFRLEQGIHYGRHNTNWKSARAKNFVSQEKKTKKKHFFFFLLTSNIICGLSAAAARQGRTFFFFFFCPRRFPDFVVKPVNLENLLWDASRWQNPEPHFLR